MADIMRQSECAGIDTLEDCDRVHVEQEDAGISESEEGYYKVVNNGVKAILEVLKRRYYLVGCRLDFL